MTDLILVPIYRFVMHKRLPPPHPTPHPTISLPSPPSSRWFERVEWCKRRGGGDGVGWGVGGGIVHLSTLDDDFLLIFFFIDVAVAVFCVFVFCFSPLKSSTSTSTNCVEELC